MEYWDGLIRTQKGRTTWEVFYSGPGPGLPGRRGTRSKEPRIGSVTWEVKETPPERGDTNVYSSVSGPGVDIPSSRCLSRTEVAAYESLENGVPSVRHYATVQRMCKVLWFRILSIPEIRW